MQEILSSNDHVSRTAIWPRWWRLLLACVIAPIPPSVLLSAALQLQTQHPQVNPSQIWTEALLFLVMGGYPCELLIGAPICIILRRAGPAFALFVLVGIFVTGVPWLLAALTQPNIVGFTPGSISSAAGLGALGGLTFWVVAVWRDPRLRRTVPP